jgi:NodT family efflux transporter outer membrane factor (OMF) lipoprotein
MLLVSVLSILGCATVGPNYEKPAFEQQVELDVADGEYVGLVPKKADIQNWWRIFNDPTLNLLINEAISNNIDIKVALSNIDESRAQYGVTRSRLLPAIDGAASVARGRQGDSGTGVDRSSFTQYAVGIDTSWEIDLWGKIRRSIEASEAKCQATEEQLNDLLISVCADVARRYFTIRTLQSQVAITVKNIDSQKIILKMVQDRRAAGISSGLEENQSMQVYSMTQTYLPSLKTELSNNINRLSFLLGQPTGYVNDLLTPLADVPLPPEDVAIDIPADRLRLRPDVRQSERLLVAQTARVGVATAELYPTLSLFGSLGTDVLNVGDLFSSGSSQFSIGPSVKMNLFNRNELRQQIIVEDERAKQALYHYEMTVLLAVEEIENALVTYHEQQIQLRSLKNAQVAAQLVMDKSQDLYRSGLIDFQVVLDAQRTLLEMENNYEAGRGNTSIYLVDLYRALAGGWENSRDLVN